MYDLHAILCGRVEQWRMAGYPCEEHPAITEMLLHQTELDTGMLRFLRRPQMRALETYWYLRLVEGTPHVFDLYRTIYSRTAERVKALGIPHGAFEAADYDLDALWDRIKTDDPFVRTFQLESVRETLTLKYASYIFALAMGAGKTILIGAIMATEFAMALEYPDGPFIENALVFAPGKTIIESLRELTTVPYDKILPPRFFKPFVASVKLTITRDSEKDIPVIRGSSFNVVITNTEKIRIQKEAIRRSDIGKFLSVLGGEDQAREAVANLRLRAIASLPRLAIFSDEAHHTYGVNLLGKWEKDPATGQPIFRDAGVKKVRKTVDYLAANTDLVCVVNTTGTPYFQRQPLKDVVIWYGLSQGIQEGILKDVSGNIHAYSFEASDAQSFISEVVTDFFTHYAAVRLPDGAPAKLAIYFPQTDDLESLRPLVEATLLSMGQSPAIVLKNTVDSAHEEIDAFNRLNDPRSPHRVILLVNKGTEGWNCPSLFACALARKLTSSNNFILQAATRCLRQVPGNNVKARIYLSMDNRAILDRQLQETYGETIADLERTGRESRSATLTLRKLNLPPLVISQNRRTVVRLNDEPTRLALEMPEGTVKTALTRSTYNMAVQAATSSVLRVTGDTMTIATLPNTVDLYTAAVHLAGLYRSDLGMILSELRGLYREGDVPRQHMISLARQIEEQTRNYTVKIEQVEVALALVKREGFTREINADGLESWVTEIVYPKDREHLLTRVEDIRENPGRVGFHYTPYNFDSNPEKSFFEQILAHLSLEVDDVEDVYFTGALTDPAKTDFYVEYREANGRPRRYTPDFIIRRKAKDKQCGKCLIVEIKSERERPDPVDGEQGSKALAVRKLEELNPERIQYEMIFTSTDTVTADQMRIARSFVEEERP